jgi:predicted transposase/invertase (TIGR01784 family)
MAEEDDGFKEHDELFHTAFASKHSAAQLLASVLPEDLARRIDLGSLEPRSTKFTGPHLSTRHSDLLFVTKLDGREVLIYVLIEHQSTSEPLMMVRLLLYMALTWDGYLREHKPARYVPPILPVVVHHSESGWRAARRFEDVIEPETLEVEGVLRYVPRFEMILDDLSKATDEELKGRGLALLQALALWVLRDARNPDRFLAHLSAWAELLEELADDPAEVRALEVLMRYLTKVLGADRADEVRQRLLLLAPGAERAMQSIADMWEQKGIEKGIEKGQQSVIRRLLEKKFGPLPESIVARLDAAPAAELEQYAERLLNAQTLTDVFES